MRTPRPPSPSMTPSLPPSTPRKAQSVPRVSSSPTSSVSASVSASSPSPRKGLFSSTSLPPSPPPKKTSSLSLTMGGTIRPRKLVYNNNSNTNTNNTHHAPRKQRKQLCFVLFLSTMATLWLVAQFSIVGWIGIVTVDYDEEGRGIRRQLRYTPNHHHPSNMMGMMRRRQNQNQKRDPLSPSKTGKSPPDNRFDIEPNDPEEDDDPKLVHIVHTRFMQHQTNLTTLGVARLQQFLTFCLPTMVQQSTQDFFWIIKVDPELEKARDAGERVFKPLLEAVEEANRNNPRSNIYLVGSNYNHNLQGNGSWRNGQEGEELLLPVVAVQHQQHQHQHQKHQHQHQHQHRHAAKPITNTTTALRNSNSNSAPATHDNTPSLSPDTENTTTSTITSTSTTTPAPGSGSARVYSGDLARLRRAHQLREALPVLETRLDADDGLHREYLERVQTMALRRFLGQGGVVDAAANADNTNAAADNTNANANANNANEDADEDADADADADANNATVEDPHPPRPRWLYWCIRTQIEWHSETNPEESLIRTDVPKNKSKLPMYHGNSTVGYLGILQNDQFCITPGLTVGYGVGVGVGDTDTATHSDTDTDTSVPRYQHTQLWSNLHGRYKLCHDPADHNRKHKGPCLELIGGTEEERLEQKRLGKPPVLLHALRSRTLTSAGMMGILTADTNAEATANANEDADADANANAKESGRPGNGNGDDPSSSSSASSLSSTTTKRDANIRRISQRMQELLWTILVVDFGLDPDVVRRTQSYLLTHRREIAYQNSLGQCTSGHSCKVEARELLNEVLRQN